MSIDIFLALAQDGLTNGAIYSLIAVALVIVFAVTRVIFVQSGEFVTFGALSLLALQQGRAPLSLWIMLAACFGVAAAEAFRLARRRARFSEWARSILIWAILPAALAGIVVATVRLRLPMIVEIVLALGIVTPLGPAMYRLGYQRIADAPIVVLLVVSVAMHFVMDGLALFAFGPDGARTAVISSRRIVFGNVAVPVQAVIVYVAAALLVALLFWFSRHTMYGRALRATASNRRGAVLNGIGVETPGMISFAIGAFICAAAGILIAPFVTIYYNSGFFISLKAFVGAMVGGMVSYPLAALGAIAIGVFEGFAAFWSSAYKDVLVFALMLPVLFGCSLLSRNPLDEDGEKPSPERRRRLPAAVERSLVSLCALPQWRMIAAVFVLLAALPLALSLFYVSLLSYVFIYAIVAFGVVLLTGIAGQLSFGQAAFVGVAAYSSAVLTTRCALAAPLIGATCGLSPWLALPVALLITGLCALVLGSLTLRMRGHFLPIATIAWAVAIFFLFANTDAIGGSTGMTDIPRIPLLSAFGIDNVAYETQIYYLVLVAMLGCGLATSNLLNSRIGSAIRALKSQAGMAASVGVDTFALKLKVFLCAAVFAGISGWLYAHLERFVNPSPFSLTMGVEYIFMIVVGGAGQVVGAVLGSATVRVLNDVLQDALSGGLLGRSGNFEMVFFGIAIIVMLQRAQGGIAAVFARLQPLGPATGRIVDKIGPRAQTAATVSRLRVERVSKRFGGLTAVDDISFDVGPGEIVALIGPNGAGKSTMFNLITGVLRANGGEIHYGDRRIDRTPSHKIARTGFARTFQHVRLLADRTVLENVALGAYRFGGIGMLRSLMGLSREEDRALLAAAIGQLERVGLRGAADRAAGTLPLGQQRIVEIARALALRPAMLLLDEPAAGLRHGEKKELATLLRSLRDEGMSILLVEHDVAFVMDLADRVVVQNFGRKLADGAPRQVRINRDVQEAYLGGAA
jgi:branched-chain amino acid transport system ATP-binding protein